MGGKCCNVWGKTKRVTGYLQGGSPHPGPAAWQPERGAEWAEAWPGRGRGRARGGAGPRRQHDPARRTPARLRQGECKYLYGDHEIYPPIFFMTMKYFPCQGAVDEEEVVVWFSAGTCVR